jgi:hypothetical protein
MGLFALFTASLSLVVAGGSLNGYGYDGGVYLGAATRLAHGTLPYKDFVFVHPPGILLLLSPLAGGSWIFGTGFEVVAGRVFDLALIGLACGLGAAILQRLGTAAALIGGSFLALVGAAASVATQLKLEPPLIAALFAMMLLSFRDATTIAGSRRLAIGGAFGGLALSIKLWALVPLGILMVVIFWRHRSAVRSFLLGLGTAAGVIVLPFLLISPGGFARDVIAAQVGRSAGGEHTPGIFGRLDYLAYYVLRPLAPHTSGFGVVLLLVLVLLGLDVFLRRRTLVLLEIVLYLCVPATLSMLLFAPVFSTYYSWYFAAFLALGVGASAQHPLSRLFQLLKSTPLRGLSLIGFSLIVLVFGLGQWSFTRAFVSTVHTPGPSSLLSNLVPTGACTLSNDAWVTLQADRFIGPSRCPGLVDAKGEWLALAPGHTGPPGPSPSEVSASWLTMFKDSQWVILNTYGTSTIPWTPSLQSWFATHFRRVGAADALTVFEHQP